MKQKYTITVADMELNIVSDASPDEVEGIVTQLDRRMKDISYKSPRCTKTEAAVLCALAYSSERNAMQEAFKKVEKDAFRFAGENEKLKKTIERMQDELDNLRRDAEVMRTIIDRTAAQAQGAEKAKYIPKSPKKAKDVTQISAFDTAVEEPATPAVQPTAPVPAAADAEATEKKAAPKGKKAAKSKSHIGNMFDLLTFSDV